MNPRWQYILGEWMRFLGVGMASYGLGAGISYVLREIAGLSPQVAVAISLSVMLLTNFVLNRVFVFRAGGDVGGGFLRFALASGAMRGAEYVLFLLLLKYLHLNYLTAFTLALIISNGVKFVLYRSFVFGGIRRGARAAP